MNVTEHKTQIAKLYHMSIDMLIAADQELKSVILSNADQATIQCYQEAYTRANARFLEMEKLMMEASDVE